MGIPSPLSNLEIVPNPYPVYAELAENAPVHWCEGLNAWAVMTYEDCANALKDPRFKAERMEEVLSGKFDGRTLSPDNIYHRFTKNVMMYTDEPAHTALRKLMKVTTRRYQTAKAAPRCERALPRPVSRPPPAALPAGPAPVSFLPVDGPGAGTAVRSVSALVKRTSPIKSDHMGRRCP